MSSPTPMSSDVYPSLSYDDAAAAIEWLCRAFGFEKMLVVPGPNGRVVHSELRLGSTVVMVSTSKPEAGRVSPRRLSGVNQAVCLHIDDPDRHFAVANAAGARIVQPLADEDYGSRGYLAQDLEGHQWYFGTYRPGAHWSREAKGE